MSLPFFSVIIPTYNRSILCKRAIYSVLNQSYRNFECIVVDDCSTDDTLNVISDTFGSSVIVHSLTRNSGGSSKPINTGVSISNYEFVAFLDSDDYWSSDRLMLIADLILKSDKNIGLFYSSSIILGRKAIMPRIVPAYIDGYIYPQILNENIIGIASRVIVKREIFLKSSGFDENIYMDNDWDCWIRICRITNVRSFLPITVFYTENTDSISTNAIKVINGRHEFLKKINTEKKIMLVEHKNYQFQLINLLFSRSNNKHALELLIDLKFSFKKIFYILISFIPSIILNNVYSFVSYFLYFKIRFIKSLKFSNNIKNN